MQLEPTPLQAYLVPLKELIEEAEAELSEGEWSALRAMLLIRLQVPYEDEVPA